jgi:reactive intermediate/imine deaminase
MRNVLHSKTAPAAIGSYSHAVITSNTIYLSGQIPLVPETMQLVSNDIKEQTRQVFENIKAVAHDAKSSLNEVVKLTVYLIDLANIAIVNEMIAEYFAEPYPARTSIQVSALPKNSKIEIDAIIVKSEPLQ